MIDRYTRPEMGHIFSLENKYAIWQEIEVLACEAQAELGKIGISKDEAQWIRDHANFEKAKVDEIEEVTRHDVIAFLTNMKEYIDTIRFRYDYILMPMFPRATPSPAAGFTMA